MCSLCYFGMNSRHFQRPNLSDFAQSQVRLFRLSLQYLYLSQSLNNAIYIFFKLKHTSNTFYMCLKCMSVFNISLNTELHIFSEMFNKLHLMFLNQNYIVPNKSICFKLFTFDKFCAMLILITCLQCVTFLDICKLEFYIVSFRTNLN